MVVVVVVVVKVKLWWGCWEGNYLRQGALFRNKCVRKAGAMGSCDACLFDDGGYSSDSGCLCVWQLAFV